MSNKVKRALSIEEQIIAATQNETATVEDLRKLDKRIRQLEDIFNEEHRARAATNEFMARSYNL